MPKEIEKAVYYFRKSAKQKNEYAAYQLGKLYLLGEHIKKDIELALWYLKTSATQGNPYVQYALGKLYLQGREVARKI